jgi:hypothetical protein
MVAIADHNSAENLPAAQKVARQLGISLIPALEITTREEVHVLALFETLSAAERLQERIYASLPLDTQGAEHQVLVNEHEEVLGFCPRALLSATQMGLKEAVAEVHRLGGLAVASHAEREGFGVLGVLGFLPPDVPFDALEVLSPSVAQELSSQGHVCLQGSDAHHLRDIGTRCSLLRLRGPTFRELALALRRAQGRAVLR